MRANKSNIVLMTVILTVLCMAFSGCRLLDKMKAKDELNKGVKSFKAKSFEDAALNFKTAVDLDPDLLLAREYLAEAYMQMHVPNLFSVKNKKTATDAIDILKYVYQKKEESGAEAKDVANVIQKIAVMYTRLGPDGSAPAKEWYLKQIQKVPYNAVPYSGIGVLDYNTINNDLPTDESAQSLTKERKDELMKLADEAETMLNKALAVDPKFVEALSYANLIYRKKILLTDDVNQKSEFSKKADRLAIQYREEKARLEEEKAKSKSKF